MQTFFFKIWSTKLDNAQLESQLNSTLNKLLKDNHSYLEMLIAYVYCCRLASRTLYYSGECFFFKVQDNFDQE